MKSVLLKLRNNRHWLNIWALRLICSRQELLRENLYHSFVSWRQFSGAKSKSQFSPSRRNSWILNHPLCVNSRRRLCRRLSPPLIKRHVHKRFAYFGRIFLLIKNIQPAHIQTATSLHDMALFDWTRPVGVDTKHCTQSVPGQSVDIVRRCGLGFIQYETSGSRIMKISPHLESAPTDQASENDEVCLSYISKTLRVNNFILEGELCRSARKTLLIPDSTMPWVSYRYAEIHSAQ
jgi:hypothetical protein